MACAFVLGAALAGRVAVFTIVHFTDARMQRVADTAPAELRVVSSPPRIQTEGTPAKAEEIASVPTRADVNQAPGERDVLLKRGCGIIQWVGVMAALLLAILMFQGVVLAGASAVPGVERAVSASTLVFVVMLCCLPLSRLFPEVGFDGVFVSYDTLARDSTMIRAADAAAPGGLTFYGSYLLLPAALIAALIAAAVRFRAGIEAGFIATSMSEMEERLEREIRSMKTGQLAAPRATGALNIAMSASAPSLHAAPPAFRAPGTPPVLQTQPGDSTKRPI